MIKSPVVNKFYYCAITALFPLYLNAQVCVTLYDGPDFGLNDVENYINVLEIDSSDNVWFGLRKMDGEGLGLGKYENNEWMEINNPSIIPDLRINDIAFDAHDSVWVATEHGISVFHRLSFQGRIMNTSNSTLPFDRVTAVTVDRQGLVWAGFEFGQVAFYNGQRWHVIKEWPNLMVYDLAVGLDNSLWIALDGSPGIVVFKDTTWIQVHEVVSIRSLTLDPFGRILAIHRDSLMIFNGLGFPNIVKPEPGIPLLDVTVGPMGGIWASTHTGLLFRSGDTFRRYGNHNSAVPATVSNPIRFNSMGQLWFGYTYTIGTSNFSGSGFLYRTTDPQEALVTSDRPGNEFCFGDSLTLMAEDGTAVNYVWPDGTHDMTYVLYDGQVVEYAEERENQCYFYDTVVVTVQKVYEEEKVCAVSVDSTGSILVIWEKTAEVGTESFNVYRLSDTNSWDFVANIPMNRLSVFEDWNADARLRSQQYKISCVDTCGNESGQSFYHNTLHLTSWYGDQPDEVRLTWNQYESAEYAEYIIYSGTTPETMQEFARVPTDVQTYVLMGVLDTLYYQIGIKLPADCVPTENLKAGTGPYTHSLSNLDDNRKLITHISEPGSVREIQAYPNPFSEQTHIEFSNPGRNGYDLTVYNMGGQKVREIRQIRDSQVILKRDGLENGFYVFELKGINTYRGKFVVR
jgi:hypothetical protein